MKSAASKKYSPFRIALLVLVIFALSGGYYTAYIYGSDLSGRILKETVSLQSDGDYQINFLNIDLSLLQKELHITDLVLEPTGQNKDHSREYTIRIPDLKIKLGSILSIYWKKELGFRSIAVTDPEIYILKKDSSSSKTTLSLESGDLYKLINQYLFRFSIDSLGIQNAMVNYNSQVGEKLHLVLKEIDFGIRNLAIDSANIQSKFLYTDDIILTFTNQKFELADSIHTLKFDAFELSTKSQDITFRNLTIKEDRLNTSKEIHNSYNIEIPELNFRGIDFQRAYAADELHLDTVRFINPRISLVKRNASKIDQKDLPRLFFRLFNEVHVGNFYINDASINLKVDQPNQHPSIIADNLSVNILNFRFDSTHIVNPLDLAYFDQFSLSSNNVKLLLPDSSHSISINNIRASSLDSTLLIEDLILKPLLSEMDSQVVIGTIQYLELTGLDYSKAWLLKKIDAHALTVMQAHIDLELQSDDQQKRQFGMIKTIDLDSIRIVQSSIKVKTNDWLLTTKDFNTLLSDISFDENTQIRKLNRTFKMQKARSSEFQFVNNLYRLDLDKFETSAQFKNSRFSHIHFEQQGDSHPVNIDQVNLSGFSFDKLFEKELIIFDTLDIQGPRLNINLSKERNLKKDKINDIIHKISFNRVLVNKGHVNIYKNNEVVSHLDSIAIALSSFHYDSIINEYFTGIDFHADSFHISMPDIHHGLSGKSITVSQSDSTLDIFDLALTPYQSDSAYNHFNVNSRELKLQHLNFHKLLNTGEIEFRTGMLRSPKVNIRLELENKEEASKKRDAIKFDSFNLTNGHLTFVNEITGFSLESHSFNALIHDFDILNDTSLFHAKNYLFDALNATVGIRKLNDSIRIGKTQINSKTGHLVLNNLHYSHADNLEVAIKKAELKGLNTSHLLDQKKLKMDSLLLDSPVVHYGLKENNSPPKESPPGIEIKGIQLRNGLFNIFREDLNMGDTISLQNFTLNINGFAYDSSSQIEFSHHLFESLDFSGSSFSYNLPDEMYIVEAETYSYDHITKTILLDEFKYSPIYNRGEFQTMIQYQKDWIDGSINQLVINGFELDSLISNQKVQANRIFLDQLRIDTHRDKRLPKEPETYKPLPQSLLTKIPYRVVIDSIILKSAYVSHSEFSENGELPGVIYFRGIDASLKNVTNDPDAIQKSNSLNFTASGSLMNTGNFQVFSTFDLTDSLDAYQLNGKVGEMDLTELNGFLEHTAFVQIRGGKSQEVTFEFEANEDYSLGEMKFYYTGLKITILDQNNVETHGFGSSVKTFFANTFVVNSKNPHFIFVRDGDIFHERDKSKSIFNYWAKSLLSGVVSSIGAKNNKKTIRQQNEEIRAKFDRMKKDN
ncbi:MAG: hypothetical protein RIC35_15215 [Marinoscillum sp.]